MASLSDTSIVHGIREPQYTSVSVSVPITMLCLMLWTRSPDESLLRGNLKSSIPKCILYPFITCINTCFSNASGRFSFTHIDPKRITGVCGKRGAPENMPSDIGTGFLTTGQFVLIQLYTPVVWCAIEKWRDPIRQVCTLRNKSVTINQ